MFVTLRRFCVFCAYNPQCKFNFLIVKNALNQIGGGQYILDWRTQRVRRPKLLPWRRYGEPERQPGNDEAVLGFSIIPIETKLLLTYLREHSCPQGPIFSHSSRIVNREASMAESVFLLFVTSRASQALEYNPLNKSSEPISSNGHWNLRSGHVTNQSSRCDTVSSQTLHLFLQSS
jgi:hypothetical protein